MPVYLYPLPIYNLYFHFVYGIYNTEVWYFNRAIIINICLLFLTFLEMFLIP